MKTTNEIKNKIQYNKLIELINERCPGLEIQIDINNKDLFSVWRDYGHYYWGHYYLYVGETDKFLYYIEFDSVHKPIENIEFLNNFVYKVPKLKTRKSFWDELVSRKKFIFLL